MFTFFENSHSLKYGDCYYLAWKKIFFLKFLFHTLAELRTFG